MNVKPVSGFQDCKGNIFGTEEAARRSSGKHNAAKAILEMRKSGDTNRGFDITLVSIKTAKDLYRAICYMHGEEPEI